MTRSAHARTNLFAFLAVLALSALTMIWLFWHYPLKTSIATVAVLAAFGVAARLARSIDTDGGSDLDQHNSNF
ncbi:MAG: hypothetical protein ACLP2F_15660 [Steroidobacteraceae bacterium]